MSSLYKCGIIDLPSYVKEGIEKGIPKISKDKLLELYSKVKPIITINGDKYLLDNLTLEDLTSLAYLSLEKNNTKSVIDNCRKLDITSLKQIKDFICLHKYGFSLQFRPSINEILSQLPEDLIEEIDAFEIVEKPVLPNALHYYTLASKNNYHLSKVMTYKIKQG